MRVLLPIVVLVAVARASEFEVDVTFTCQTTDNTGACSVWKQNGKIKQNSACFPPSALVQTPKGHKTLGDLAIGDEVLAMSNDGRVTFSPVRAWFHRDPTSEVTYLALKTAAGTLRATPTHNVYVASQSDGGAYLLAEQVKVGDLLRTPKGVAKVDAITEMVEKGAFAPLTYESTLFVGDDADALLLAHSYAAVSNPTFFWQPAFNTILSAAEMAVRDVHAVEDPAAPYLHPVAKLVAPLFGIDVEPKIVKEFKSDEIPTRDFWSQWSTALVLPMLLSPAACAISPSWCRY